MVACCFVFTHNGSGLLSQHVCFCINNSGERACSVFCELADWYVIPAAPSGAVVIIELFYSSLEPRPSSSAWVSNLSESLTGFLWRGLGLDNILFSFLSCQKVPLNKKVESQKACLAFLQFKAISLCFSSPTSFFPHSSYQNSQSMPVSECVNAEVPVCAPDRELRTRECCVAPS